jgi:uncharacterized repeat protein (TIGR01451 family)
MKTSALLPNLPQRLAELAPRSGSRPAGLEPLEARIAPALVLALSDVLETTTPGSVLAYTLDYANTGDDDASGVVLTHTLPEGLIFDEIDNPGWSLDAGTLTFTVGDLAAGADGQVTLSLRVADVAPAGLDEIVQTATITRDGATDPEATAVDTTTLEAAPDLTVSKIRNEEGPITPGSAVSYTLEFTNVGDQDATGVVLSEQLPAGTIFDADNSSAGWVEVEPGSGLYQLAIGPLAGGGGMDTRTFAVRVADAALAGLEAIVNTVSITDDGTNGADPTPTNNQSTTNDTLIAAPDLTLLKTAVEAAATAGGTVTFTFDYTNLGDQDASGVVLSDVLPAYATFDPAANPGWTLEDTTLTFAVGALAAGGQGQATLVLGVATAIPAGVEEFSNAASIADDGAGGADANLSDNSSTVTLPLLAAPDLTLAKSDGRESVRRGQALTYTLTYANNGTQGATGVVITDTLPEGTIFDSEDNPGWSFDEGTGVLTFTVGSLAAGAQGSATLRLRVADELPDGLDTITNTASIADDGANGADPTPSDNTDTDINAIVTALDLALAKSADVGSVAPGGTVVFTFDYANVGDFEATGVVLTDALPAGLLFDGEANPGWVLEEGVLTFTIGDLASGAQGTLTLTLTAAATAPAGRDAFTNSATLTDDGANGPDFTPDDNTATATVLLDAAPDLTLTKLADAATVQPGGTLTFTFNYSNAGNQDATGVVLTDVLGVGLVFDAEANPGWTLDGTTLTFAIGALAAGAEGTATLTLSVAATVPAGLDEIVNSASIADDGSNGDDLTPTDNTAAATVILDAAPDLTLTKTDGREAALRGQTLTYVFTYTNVGNQRATGVLLSDTLPEGTTFDAAENPDWSFDELTGELTFVVGDLAAGAEGTATLILRVALVLPDGFESVVNTAGIADDGSNGDDLDPSNNTATDTTAIVRAVDLTLGKSSDVTSVTPGGTIVYTFSYANVGDLDAAGVVLSDELPLGLTFDFDLNPGWVLTGTTLTYAIGDVIAGGLGTITLTLTAAATAPAGLEQIVNSASIADDGTQGADFTPGDNTATATVAFLAAPDLTLTKDGGGTTVAPGGTVTYTFTFGNAGDQDATGVVITDVLPDGTTFDPEANPGWVLDGTTLTYAIGSLAAGGQDTITLVLGVGSSAPAGVFEIVNTASISDDGTSGEDANPADNTATASNPLQANPDLVLSFAGGAASGSPGGVYAFTLNYSNTGNRDATGVVLTEQLPAGTTFNAAASTPGWFEVSPGVFQLALGTLAGGGSGSAVFAVTVNSPAAAGQEQFATSASIADDGAGGADPTPTNNAATASAALNAAPNLAVTLTASRNSILPGQKVTYSITYTNLGNQNATGVKLTEILPSGLAFVAAGSTSGWNSIGGGRFEFLVGSLAVGQSVTVTFQAKAAASLSVNKLTNRVTIADDGAGGADSNPANNEARRDLPVGAGNPGGGGGTPSGIRAVVDGNKVKVFNAQTGAALYKFQPYDDGVKRIRIALGDINGDRIADIITTSRDGTGQIRAFDGRTGKRIDIGGKSQLDPFKESYANGAYVAVADFNRDGIADIVVGESGRGEKVKIYDGKTGREVNSWKPFGSSEKGIRVSVSDINGDGIADIFTRERGSDKVLVFSGATAFGPNDPLKIRTLTA